MKLSLPYYSAGCFVAWALLTHAAPALRMDDLARAAQVPLASAAPDITLDLSASADAKDIPAARMAFIRACQREKLAVRWNAAMGAYDIVARDGAYDAEWQRSCEYLRAVLPAPAPRAAAAQTVHLRTGALPLDAVRAAIPPRTWLAMACDHAGALADWEVEEYLGNNVWLARAPKAVAAAPGVRATASLAPAHKVEPILFDPAAYIVGDDPAYRVLDVHGFRSQGIAGVSRAVEACGGEILSRVTLVPAVVCRVPLEAVAALAQHHDVKWIGKTRPGLGICNANSRANMGVNTAQSAPYDYRGADIDVLVYDAGVVDNHTDFSGRLTIGETASTHYHATHVAGTVLGSGSVSGGGLRGMAPEARLISYRYDFSGMIFYNNPGDLETNYAAAINLHGADLANNSIGMNIAGNGYPAAYYGDYETSSILMDEITRGRLGKPFLSVWAAGNERGYVSGYRNISPPQCAKNILVIGATRYDNNQPTTFTSWGPLDDGRLKPDLCAPGYVVTSCYQTSSYQALSGTSMASPGACGSTALLLQCWRAQYGGADPSPAMIKALLINTTLDLEAPGPGFETGYGLLQIVPALDTVRAGNHAESSIAQGALRRFPVIVPASAEYVRVTLAWSDPPASALAPVVLVNDLDLRLIAPDNRVFLPWVLDPNNPANPATTNAPDRLNNVEQVWAPNVMGGTWFAEVRGFAIALGPTQAFSLCANYLMRDVSSAGQVQLDRSAYRLPGPARIEVRDWDLTNQSTCAVLASSSYEPAGESVVLTQITEGVFAGEVMFVGAPPAADGMLSVLHGSTVTVQYVDADDGMGANQVTNIAHAMIDLAAPVIFDIAATNVSDSEATITWRTDESARGTLVVPALSASVAGGSATSHSMRLTNLTPITTYAFYLVAQDEVGNVATNDNAGQLFSFTTKMFMAQWESTAEPGEAGRWALTNGWHQSARRPLAGTHSWYCGQGHTGVYANSITTALVSTAIELHESGATLRFREYIDTEGGYDFCRVQISSNAAATWHDLRPAFSGLQSTRDVVLELGSFAPGTVHLRFLFTSDSSVVREGWYVDELYVGGYAGGALMTIGQQVSDPAPGGDADGFIEPGETFALHCGLLNGLPDAVTNVSGVLASQTPLATVVAGTSAYGTMAPGAVASNASAFVVALSGSATNNASLPFLLVCTDAAGRVTSNTFALTVQQRYAIAGFVRDLATATAVTNATVFWQTANVQVQPVGMAGAFRVIGLQNGPVAIWADAPGFTASDTLLLTCPPDVVNLMLDIGRPVPACHPPVFDLNVPLNAVANMALVISNAGHGRLDYLLAPSNSIAFAHGFDNAGEYRWIDSNTPGCPDFAWIDISTNAQVITLGDDQVSSMLTLAHVFPWYGRPVSNIWIGSNGGIALNTYYNIPSYNTALPASTAPPDFLAPYWDDLNPAAGGTIYFKSFADHSIVSFVDVKRYGQTVSALTFQTIMYANGAVRYQYLSLQGTLVSTTVGWQAAERTKYAQMVFNANYVRNLFVVSITPGHEWLRVGSAGGSVAPFGMASVPVVFDAQGLSTGVYYGAVQVTSEGGDISVPVTMTIVPESAAAVGITVAVLCAWRRRASRTARVKTAPASTNRTP